MTREVIRKAAKVLEKIREGYAKVEILKEITDKINKEKYPDIPADIMLPWLDNRKLNLKTELKQLEKEFKDL